MNTDNPSAFPVPELRDAYGQGVSEGSPGMTLRDWFAGQAATMPAPNFWRGYEEDALGTSAEAIARRAYSIADAMLAARSAAPAAPDRMQHVAYYDEGAFHWMSGVAPRECELFAKSPA